MSAQSCIFHLYAFFPSGQRSQSTSNFLRNCHCGSLLEENSQNISTSISLQKVNEVYSSGIPLLFFLNWVSILVTD